MKMTARTVREAGPLLDALRDVGSCVESLGSAEGAPMTFTFGASADDEPDLADISLPSGMIRDTLLHLTRLIADRLTAMGVDPWA